MTLLQLIDISFIPYLWFYIAYILIESRCEKQCAFCNSYIKLFEWTKKSCASLLDGVMVILNIILWFKHVHLSIMCERFIRRCSRFIVKYACCAHLATQHIYHDKPSICRLTYTYYTFINKSTLWPKYILK